MVFKTFKKKIRGEKRQVLLRVSGPLKCEEAKLAMRPDRYRFHEETPT